MLLLPVPELKHVRKYQVSVLLVLFMVGFHFLVEFNKVYVPKLEFSEDKSASYFKIQAKLYERHLKSLKSFKSSEQRLMASVVDAKSSVDESFLASFTRVAILDNTFDPLKISSAGLDSLEYADWLDVHSIMRKNLQLSPAYLLGLNDQNYSWDRWLSYMFVHIGFLHLFSNALFLLLFGALIETLFGGVVVTLVFIGSGFLAAPIYMLLNDLNQVSLVGASGGVCGLIAFYSISQFKEKIRFFYWVLPFEKYYGFLSLSCGYIFLIWILSDLAGYFAGVGFLDSVAYGAHLGGFLVGGLCALGLNFYKTFGFKNTASSAT